MAMAHERSEALYSQACRLMPGGVNSPARAFGAVGGTPIVMQRAAGPYLFDVDGNRYVDYIGSWGPMILGHAHPRVCEAVEQAVSRGTSFGAPTEAENQLAELIIDAVPSVDMVRLVNSGTEATMSAIRLARGFTKRNRIVKFSGNYHGHVDALLVAAGSAGATLAAPDSPGVTPGAAGDTIILEYNDIAGVQQAFEQQGPEIAAVILEPVVGNMGCVVPDEAFLSTLRRLTEQHGALLIYDEVMTGFRVAYGGAQSLHRIQPDLTTLGKIVGGGLPLGAYGGRSEIMQQVLPTGKVFQAGTLSGNPVATAAGIATLSELRENPPYEFLEQRGQQLAEGLDAAAEAAEIPHRVQRVGSMLTLFFVTQPVHGWKQASTCDTQRYARFFWSLIERGVYFPCSQYEALFLSATHSATIIDETVAAAEASLMNL